jgi:DnaJ family protein C protein 27
VSPFGFPDTQGVLLVYDVSQRQSFEAMELWLDEMRVEAGGAAEAANAVVVVCGNKIDKGKAR